MPVIPILMPQASQSMEEGTIVKWRVEPGARIRTGEIIFDVETDKATVEVEATDEGRLARIVVPVGGTLAVKLPVAFLAENDADVDAYLAGATRLDVETGVSAARHPSQKRDGCHPPPAATAPSSTGSTTFLALGAGERPRASPAARKLARERHLDLAALGSGSGPRGRLISGDVLTVKAAPAAAGPDGGTRRRMSKMRRAIARNLLLSKQTIPHFYARITLNAGPLLAFYRAHKPRVGCTLNDVVTFACARAIREFPQFRSQLDGDDLLEFPAANIGIAVGVADGLVVPVLLGADHMSLAELSAASKRIIEGARAGRLEGTGRGNFTITNLGMFGVEEFAAIINPPEAAILAVAAVREAALVKDGVAQPGHALTLTLSCDHRIIDGVLAAKFLARLKELLEAPETLNK